MISCQINFFLPSLSLCPARKHHTRWFFESHSRGNRRIVLRNKPEYRGAYAFNRIVNPFLSSVRAEQLENCMQMQKYSDESARAPRDFLSIPDERFSSPASSALRSFVVRTLFYFPTLLVFSTTCSFFLSLFLFSLIKRFETL